MRYLKHIVGVVAGITLVGCSSFLEENPDQRTKIDSPEKIKELLVFAYPSANNFYALEAMTDNFGDSKRTQYTALDNTAYYSWKDEKLESTDSPASYWAEAYSAIAQANQALESVEKVTMSKDMYNAIKGEALLARAYAHWMLATTFCEAYDPNTAESIMGIPYVDQVEEVLIKEYDRGTLANVYSKIEADVEEGVRLATNDFKVSPKFHFTKDAGRAFATRFYAHKGDWEKVLEYSAFLTDSPVNLRDYANYVGMPDFQGQLFGGDNEKANLLIVGSRSLLRRTTARARFGVDEITFRYLVGSTYNPYGRSYMYDGYTGGGDIVFYPRFFEYFVYSNQSAGIGQAYVNIPLLTTDETYLYRIEAKIMAEEYEEAARMMGYFSKWRTNGGKDLNENSITSNALVARVADASEYQPFYELNDKQRKMFKFLAEMRRSEFLHLGNRWFDIKRFNLSVEHRYLIEGSVEVLTAKDPRKAIQLPQSALSAGLKPNIR